jgi:AAA+ superfamily predicted ATPase
MSENEKKEQAFFKETTLPDPDLGAVWRSTVADAWVKNTLLHAMLAAPQLDLATRLTCAVYGLVLLYGEAGCGKSSLARGAADEAAKREYARTGRHATLLELNVASIFSEYLGETLKRIADAFGRVRFVARHNRAYVLLDELESVALERRSVGAGDPSDVVRAVNAFLVEIDALRAAGNVVVVGTSNMSGAVDRALRDRSDLHLHIGRPNREAARKILAQSFAAFRRFGVTVQPSYWPAVAKKFYGTNGECGPFSGRVLARLPYVALLVTGKKNLSVQDVLRALAFSMSNDGKESNHGKHD